MLNRRQKAVIAVLACLVIGIGFLDRQTSLPPQNPVDSQRPENTSNKSANDNPLKLFWNWTTSDAVSFYTLVLAIFTGVLGVTAIKQIEYLRRADETSRISAVAAENAAKAAVSAQRPWLTLSIEKFGWVAKERQFAAQFRTQNIGPSPATTVHINAKVGVATPDIQIAKFRAFTIGAFEEAALMATIDEIGDTLFPTEEITREWRIGINPNEIDAALTAINGRNVVAIKLIATVTYRYAGGNGQTTIIAHAFTQDPKSGVRQHLDPAEDWPASAPWHLIKTPVGQRTF